MAFSRKQKKVLAFQYTNHDALICDGAVRSGKTTIMTVAYADWAMANFNHRRFIVGGKTVGSAVRNVIEPYLALSYARSKYELEWKSGKSRLVVRKGDRENWFDVFGGKDKSSYQLVQGFTAAGCLIDEVTLCDEAFVNQCLARCSVDGSRFWFDCNPESPMHWFKKEWIDKAEERNALRIHFSLRDNPSLSPHVIERYESMYTGVFRRRYIDGDWVQAEGLVYPMERETYTVGAFEVEKMTMRAFGDGTRNPAFVPGRWVISVDYGISNPFAAILWYVTPSCAYAVDEYYHNGREQYQRTDNEHMDAVERLAGGRPIDQLIIDPSATSFKVEANRRGRFFVRDADNDVSNGITFTANCLANGRIKISEKCWHLLEEMDVYSWDDESEKDKPIKENDHACDAMRYMAYTELVELFC